MAISAHADVIRRFYTALPQVRAWIDELLLTHSANARKVSTLGFDRLASCYPGELLERAHVVSVERTPFPPVSQFGLPEFAQLEGRQFEGITFKNTFFVVRGREFESLHFHELVHVVQWSRLGVDRFLLSYGLGLLQFGYEQSPLEQMAYSLQQLFERGSVPNNLVRIIESGADGVWKQVAQVVGAPRAGTP
jgi:hypothetical protein